MGRHGGRKVRAKSVRNLFSKEKKSVRFAVKLEPSAPSTPISIPRAIPSQPQLDFDFVKGITNKSKTTPINALEYINFLIQHQNQCDPDKTAKNLIDIGFTNTALSQLENERSQSDTSGYNGLMVNALFSCYFDRDDCAFLADNRSMGGYQGKGKNSSNPIAYFPVLDSAYQPSDVKKIIKDLLEGLEEKRKAIENSGHIMAVPRKIFIPMCCFKGQNGMGHTMLMVVEPSATTNKSAAITMINTSVNCSGFGEYELAAIQGAKEVYSHPTTTAVRNRNDIYSTSRSCGADVVELARSLIDIENVQAYVNAGHLQRKSPKNLNYFIVGKLMTYGFFFNVIVRRRKLRVTLCSLWLCIPKSGAQRRTARI